jgi:bifunctional non-homologous end joining protein LigD
MAAAFVKEPFDSPDWIFEPKLDGYRAITVIDSTGKARLWSCNHLPLESKFPTIQVAVNELKVRSTILDGEIVALDKDSVSRFKLLQQWQKRPTAPVVLYLFDLLWSDGRDITGKTVLQRRNRLEQIIDPVPGIQVGGYVEIRGIDLYRLAKEKGLEGIIAKRKTSTYRPGKRSPDWLKIKARPQQEFVVCGFTEGKGSRKYFGALLLGGYQNGGLPYFGHSGTGFSVSIASFNPFSLNPTPFNGNLAAFFRAIQFSDDAQRFASTICGRLYSDHGPPGTSAWSMNRQSTRSKDPSPR